MVRCCAGKCSREGRTGRSCRPTAWRSWTRATRCRPHDGKLIYIQNAGVRHASPEATKKLLAGEAVDPSQVYFKTVPTFETAAPDLQWLDASIFVGTGERYPTEVVIHVWRVE